ncbi:MAG: hypothetical protein HY561_09610 [Gemmatimonadetes bacterium]|nr:hypothetical protein [Gemmatimonadota bacterium]
MHFSVTMGTGRRFGFERRSGRRATALLLWALLALAACDSQGVRLSALLGAAPAELALREDAAGPAPRGETRTPRRAPAPPTRPDEIYYDLTVFEWYRRGEPLRYDGRSYQPQGMPRLISLRQLRRAGEFGGVTFYVGAADSTSHSILYVPVFDRYWQPFALQAGGSAAP